MVNLLVAPITCIAIAVPINKTGFFYKSDKVQIKLALNKVKIIPDRAKLA
jgi:hypothetical protein